MVAPTSRSMTEPLSPGQKVLACQITGCYDDSSPGTLVCGLHEGMLPVPVKILLRGVDMTNLYDRTDAIQRARSWVVTTQADEVRWRR